MSQTEVKVIDLPIYDGKINWDEYVTAAIAATAPLDQKTAQEFFDANRKNLEHLKNHNTGLYFKITDVLFDKIYAAKKELSEDTSKDIKDLIAKLALGVHVTKITAEEYEELKDKTLIGLYGNNDADVLLDFIDHVEDGLDPDSALDEVMGMYQIGNKTDAIKILNYLSSPTQKESPITESTFGESYWFDTKTGKPYLIPSKMTHERFASINKNLFGVGDARNIIEQMLENGFVRMGIVYGQLFVDAKTLDQAHLALNDMHEHIQTPFEVVYIDVDSPRGYFRLDANHPDNPFIRFLKTKRIPKDAKEVFGKGVMEDYEHTGNSKEQVIQKRIADLEFALKKNPEDQKLKRHLDFYKKMLEEDVLQMKDYEHLRKDSNAGRTDQQNIARRAAKEYIEALIKQRITSLDIAARTAAHIASIYNVTAEEFNDEFKDQTGMTIGNFVRRNRELTNVTTEDVVKLPDRKEEPGRSRKYPATVFDLTDVSKLPKPVRMVKIANWLHKKIMAGEVKTLRSAMPDLEHLLNDYGLEFSEFDDKFAEMFGTHIRVFIFINNQKRDLPSEQ